MPGQISLILGFINRLYMSGFFKTFFASLLALVIFTLLAVFLLIGSIAGIGSRNKTKITARSVLVLNLGLHYKEQAQESPFAAFSDDAEGDVPGLYDVIRLLEKAKTDKDIAGLYLKAGQSVNGFAASEELRKAILSFKQSGKFVYAFGDMISQKAYSVANVADKIFVSPAGNLQWSGFSVEYMFLKGALDKLDIHPQIFYAGKFKSATEPLRAEKMTDANALQTTVWLNDLYEDFLLTTSDARHIDTATLRRLAAEDKIINAAAAVEYKLIDGAKYDDQVRDEIKTKIGAGKYERINFVSISEYNRNAGFSEKGDNKIAVIYAEGDIIDGKGQAGEEIGSDDYRNLIRKARLDQDVKAIVFRVNSGGGSSLASDNIWREIVLARKEKPVVVSFGDVAASGGYYISCGADSVFTDRTTITGSIGVFGIVPDMQGFFKNKLGITFDGVKTAPFADAGAYYRPLTESEKLSMQAGVEEIYTTFKQRVAEGRKKDTAYVDSIAQGRVWTGNRAVKIGLADRIGGLNDAIACAARMAKLDDYTVAGYPEPQRFFDKILGKTKPSNYMQQMKAEVGEENYMIYMQLKKLKQMSTSTQARLPFSFFIH